MKGIYKVVLFLILMLSFGVRFAYTQSTPDDFYDFNFPRQNGSGGIHVTQEDGIYTLFTNPAIFAELKRKWYISSVIASRSFSPNISASNAVIATDLYGPLFFAFTNENFAVGIFNNTRIKFDKVETSYRFGEQLFVTTGYGGNVYETENHTISLGVQLKTDFFAVAVKDPFVATGTEQSEFDALKMMTSDNTPIEFDTEIGIDVGFLYDYKNFIRLGLSIRDLYTIVIHTVYASYNDMKKGSGGTTVQPWKFPNMSIGLSVAPPIPAHYRTFTGYIFWVELNDIINASIEAMTGPPHTLPFAYDFAFGMEFEFNKAYKLRLGFKELAPTVGIGIEMGNFDVDGSFAIVQFSGTPYTNIGLQVGVSFTAKL